MSYVVLDPALLLLDPTRFESLFRQFAAGYARYFSGDEAEPTSDWLARIVGAPPPQPVMRVVVAVDHGEGVERVVGGVAVEYYRRSACVLATYLYVTDDGAYRHRGHARHLLAEAHAACRALGPVRVVLAEADWPELLPPALAGGLAQARERLGFFARVGARVFQIDYVQPVLGKGKRAVSHLRLVLLPTARGRRPSDDQLATAASLFLDEFYDALAQAVGVPRDEAALASQQEALGRQRPLTVPLPRLRLGPMALTLHFVETLDGSKATDDFLAYVAKYQCRVFHSMETDLLSRAHRARRPFRTVCLTKPPQGAPSEEDAGFLVDIEFPARLTFQSENRREDRQWPLRRRRARAYLAPSIFFDARHIVWHMTLKADEQLAVDDVHGWFDEQDLIALLKLADDEADQESVRIPASDGTTCRIGKAITFRLHDGGRAALDADRLIRALGALARDRVRRLDQEDAPLPNPEPAPEAATVELLGWPIDGEADFCGVEDASAREALCGIITGIFDFDRIDDAEARDTLTASVPLDDALLRVHRERVVYVAGDDRAARAVAGAVGISPYLILPSAAVLCNHWLLRPFEIEKGPAPTSLDALSVDVRQREDALRTRWVPNPFFYPTERKLYEQAMAEGGTAARRAREEERLLEMKTRLGLVRETQRTRFEAIVTGLLGAISVVAFDTFTVDIIAWARGLGATPLTIGDKLVAHALTMLLAVLCGVFVFLSKRPRPETPADGRGV